VRRGASAAGVPERKGAAKVARPPVPPRAARKAPAVEEQSRTAVLRSFYTCNAEPMPNLTEGTGWRLVGPLRRS
jgi:hypothetical protein